MVDKLFGKVFTAMDNSKTVQQVTSLIGMQGDQIQKQGGDKPDKSLCIIHKLKKTFFCEECLFELCFTCRDKHERGHPIKFTEETAKFVTEKFKGSLDDLATLRQSLNSAANEDPTQYEIPEGQINVLEQGDKEIDHIFEKILKHLEQSKQEMKDRLKEAYIANYRQTLDKKSQGFLHNLDKLENYVNACLKDFEKRQIKGKYVIICAQRPKVDDLYKNLEKFKTVMSKMIEQSREFRNEYQLAFKPVDFENNLRDLLNTHINVSFPGLENGFFQVNKRLQITKPPSEKVQSQQQQQHAKKVEVKEESKEMFDPIRSLENEEYDIRRAKEYQQIVPIQKKPKQPSITDERYELRMLKFKKDKFEVKTYDTQSKKSQTKDILIPEECKRIATKFFSYVCLGSKKILMTGGQFVEDKTCSLDCFQINLEKQELKEMKQYMKVARMHHSMILVEEKGIVLVAGGEDENLKLLDSCEMFNVEDKTWKMASTLNQKGKNLSLCKFSRDAKRDQEVPIFIYAFGSEAIERVDVTKTPVMPRWEELVVKNFSNSPMASISFKFDDNLILICGGTDEKNSSTQDIIYFNPNKLIIDKSSTAQLKVCDKFTGGTMTQFVVNRLESKVMFCSESFVHELEYGAKAGDAKFKCKANLY